MAAILNQITAALPWRDPIGQRATLGRLRTAANTLAAPQDLFRVLRAYYYNNALYDELATMLYQRGLWRESLQPLRNPTTLACDFYVDHLWPGDLPDALPIETDHEPIVEPIHQVWTWSNWNAAKDVASLWLPMLGEWFLKVAQSDDGSQVYFQLLDPAYVVDFDETPQGFVTYVRIDTPQRTRDGDTVRMVTRTEVWDKATQTYRQWTHTTPQAPTAELGVPQVQETFAAFGIDFVPVVHAVFRPSYDPTDLRGMAAILPVLPEIDEANRQATGLYRKLFRFDQVNWIATRSGTDAQGRPLPPLKVDGTDANANVVTVGDERIYELPGGGDLKSIVPDIHYDQALAILQDHLAWLMQKLPELRYYNLSDRALSGRAIRYLLAPAVKRVERVRANAERALVRANQMALTIGVAARLPQFRGLPPNGFDAGAFDHTIAKRDVLPADNRDDAETDLAEAQAALLRRQVGVSQRQVLDELGYSGQAIEQMLAENAMMGPPAPVPPGLGQPPAPPHVTAPLPGQAQPGLSGR